MPGFTGETGRKPGAITRIEFWAIAYLAVPVVLFMIAYAKPIIGLPCAAFVAYSLWRCALLIEARGERQSIQLSLFLWLMAALTVFASGAFGGVAANSDWIKHFAVIRFILDNDSLVSTARDYDGGTLRYYLGWYLVPGLLGKAFSIEALLPLIGTWTTAGLYLFFSVAARLTERKLWRYGLPLIFLLFSGADAIGTTITGFTLGPQFHIEWWAGWIEYSSNLTDIFWAPQHALPAWLGAALALRLQRNPASLIVIPLVTTSIVLWSPFVAMGLVPFFAYVLSLNVRHISQGAVVNGILAVPVVTALTVYMRSGTEALPFAPVWKLPCLGQGPCYTFHGYLLFVGLEVVPVIFACQLATRWRSAMVWLATISLLGMPFFKFGAFNDLNLHGSIPAIAVLTLIAWQAMANSARWLRVIFAAIIVMGAPTPIQELRRAFWMKNGPTTDMTFAYLLERVPQLRSQYMINQAPWLLRRPQPREPQH